MNPPYFSNWVDQWMPRVAYALLPYVVKVRWITPNRVTYASFILYTLGSLFLFINIPYHLLVAFILLPLSYIADCLDGQLARATKNFSPIGDYLDKTLDVLKIFILSSSLSLAVFVKTQNGLYIFLGFIAAFFFSYRYYIKHEIMYTMFSKDEKYLDKSYERMQKLYVTIAQLYNLLSKTFIGKLQKFWLTQRSFFYVDEGEFIFLTCVGIAIGSLEFTLWALAISQLAWGIIRLIQRAQQLQAGYNFLNPIKR